MIMEEKAGLYPGIDIEQHTPDLLLQTADMFSSNEEQDFMKTLSLPYSEALLINFSAKESLFKSLWYENKDIINFNFSFLSDINSIQGTYTLTLSHDISTKLHAGRKFTGNYYFMNDNVITFILSSL
ncbi:hypothetical protein BSR03_04340 [Serratia proteamaculans]|nr:hypothetical protein BSR03_04340 [Serratia proteamaculans]